MNLIVQSFYTFDSSKIACVIVITPKVVWLAN